MALMCSRLLSRNVKNQLAVTSRFYATKDYRELPDPMDHATGLEKFEMLQVMKGNDDPFKMKAVKRHASTKSNPNLVPSYFDCRVVGCICEEDSSSIVWMWLFKGDAKRCKCGHWFKLAEYKPV